MSRNRLEAMLGRAPLAPMIIVSAMAIAAVSLLAYGIFAAISLRIIDLLICIGGLYFIVRYLLQHFRGTLAFTEKCKKNGIESAARLERRGLLDQADTEYNSTDVFRFRQSEGGLSPENFVMRHNALTPSFVFIMSENAVFSYDEIKAVAFYRRGKANRTKFAGLDEDCTVLELTSVNNVGFNLYACKGAFASSPTDDIICRQIIDIIEQLAPDCKIDLSVKNINPENNL